RVRLGARNNITGNRRPETPGGDWGVVLATHTPAARVTETVLPPVAGTPRVRHEPHSGHPVMELRMIVEEVVRRFVSGGVGDQDHVLVVGLHTLHQQSHPLTGVGLP